MAGRLIAIWIVLVAISALGSWLWGRHAPKPALWVRVIVAAVLLAACVASYILFGASLEKTFVAVAGYFMIWAAVFVVAAICGGVIAGSLIALLLV